MPDWITISGLITNVATALDLSYRYTPHEVIRGKDAAALLREADRILQDTNVVLENHRDELPPEQYKVFKLQYRSFVLVYLTKSTFADVVLHTPRPFFFSNRFHWQITDESQEHRAVKDVLIKQSRILSQLYANQDDQQKRASILLRSVETYQASVLVYPLYILKA